MSRHASLQHHQIPPVVRHDVQGDRTVVLSGLPYGTKWRDVSWQMEYCGSVQHHEAFEDTSMPGAILFVVVFSDTHAAEDAMLLTDSEVNGHVLTVSPVKFVEKPVTLADVKSGVVGRVQPFLTPRSHGPMSTGKDAASGVASGAASGEGSEFPEIEAFDDTLELPRAVRKKRKASKQEQKLNKSLEKGLAKLESMEVKDQVKACAGVCLIAALGLHLSTRKSKARSAEANKGLSIIEGELRKLA
eukprot:TRINITY_DN32253_c1_g1_i1.p1 TRINITY_DN32253_c1_g1~~TRINITY_DN32253_c1_g1_i1.p1  ORF type:complete len:245 (+),score=59.48 TRINITY_DN32253_c1_g1_i1:74-808(+)